MIRLTRFIAFSLLVTGCALISKARHNNLSNVRIGQSSEKVREILGAPLAMKVENGGEVWMYDILADNNTRAYPYRFVFKKSELVEFGSDTSRSAGEPPGSKKSAPSRNTPEKLNRLDPVNRAQSPSPYDHSFGD